MRILRDIIADPLAIVTLHVALVELLTVVDVTVIPLDGEKLHTLVPLTKWVLDPTTTIDTDVPRRPTTGDICETAAGSKTVNGWLG
jgi:hypothetical protein